MFICQSRAILIIFSRFMVSVRVPPSSAMNVIEVKWYWSYWTLLAWAAIVVGIFIGRKELVYWVVNEKPRNQVRRCQNIKLFHILREALRFALARILCIEKRTGGFSITTSSLLSDQSWHVPPVSEETQDIGGKYTLWRSRRQTFEGESSYLSRLLHSALTCS